MPPCSTTGCAPVICDICSGLKNIGGNSSGSVAVVSCVEGRTVGVHRGVVKERETIQPTEMRR